MTSALADALWQARAAARPLGPGELPGHRLSLQQAETVAQQLYERLAQGGGPQIGWKLGATDAPVQARLGTTAPFIAPLFRSTLLAPEAPVRLSSLVAPLLEAEIGIVDTPDGPGVMPVIELADCRFPQWNIRIGEAIADFGLHGAVAVGPPAPGRRAVLTIRHEGAVVATGSKEVSAALSAFEWTCKSIGDRWRLGTLVITGSIAAPIPLRLGHWSVDLGDLGRLDMDVVP